MLGPSVHYKEVKETGGEYVPKKAFPKDTAWAEAYMDYYRSGPR